MLLKGSLLIVASSIVGAAAFAPAQIGTFANTRTTSMSSEESITALFKKKATKKKGKAPTKGFGGVIKEQTVDQFPYAGTVRPGIQSPQKIVIDESIMKPNYADDGVVSEQIAYPAGPIDLSMIYDINIFISKSHIFLRNLNLQPTTP